MPEQIWFETSPQPRGVPELSDVDAVLLQGQYRYLRGVTMVG